MLYGAVIGGGYFKLDLDNLTLPLPFTWIIPLPAVPAFTLQLAFSFDLATLYGQDENSNWYTVDKTTGVAMSLATSLEWTSGLFLDLGGSSLVGVNGTDPTGSPSQQPSASPTPLPSGSPSQAPMTSPPSTLMPSTSPSTSPVATPSSASPTRLPTGAPTPQLPTVPVPATAPPTSAPTNFPTFAPPPSPFSPWQPVATNYVCTPEVREGRDILEGEKGKATP